jgi:hypothetical protein
MVKGPRGLTVVTACSEPERVDGRHDLSLEQTAQEASKLGSLHYYGERPSG